jgi:hypothetical protein
LIEVERPLLKPRDGRSGSIPAFVAAWMMDEGSAQHTLQCCNRPPPLATLADLVTLQTLVGLGLRRERARIESGRPEMLRAARRAVGLGLCELIAGPVHTKPYAAPLPAIIVSCLAV